MGLNRKLQSRRNLASREKQSQLTRLSVAELPYKALHTPRFCKAAIKHTVLDTIEFEPTLAPLNTINRFSQEALSEQMKLDYSILPL